VAPGTDPVRLGRQLPGRARPPAPLARGGQRIASESQLAAAAHAHPHAQDSRCAHFWRPY